MDSRKDVETMLPLVLPYVIGVPEPVALYALSGGLRDFCRRTETWRETIDVATVADKATYDLDSEMALRGAVLLRVRQIRFDDSDDSISEEYYAVTEKNQLVFDDPYPDDWGTTMNVDAVMLPGVNSRKAPAWLLDRWQEVIAEWALADLMLQVGKPWTNPEAAALHQAKYERGVGDAVGENMTGRRSGSLVISPRTFV